MRGLLFVSASSNIDAAPFAHDLEDIDAARLRMTSSDIDAAPLAHDPRKQRWAWDRNVHWWRRMAARILHRNRPVPVVIVAVLLAINGLGALLSALYPLGTGEASTPLAWNALFGTAVLVLSWGVYTLRRWAWVATLVLQIVSLVSAALALRLPDARIVATIDIGVCALTIALLVAPRTRAAFSPASLRSPTE